MVFSQIDSLHWAILNYLAKGIKIWITTAIKKTDLYFSFDSTVLLVKKIGWLGKKKKMSQEGNRDIFIKLGQWQIKGNEWSWVFYVLSSF